MGYMHMTQADADLSQSEGKLFKQNFSWFIGLLHVDKI
jgi:hypothetical protein